MRLKPGHIAVVTGAASGIGLALCKALLAAGLTVCMLDIEGEALDRAASKLGGTLDTYACDVSDPAAVTRVADDILRRHGRVDLLINNAGVGGRIGPMAALPAEDWQWVFGVNVLGVVNGLRAFVPAMQARGEGHVVNIASMAGLAAAPFMGPYVASKFAVVGLTESLAAEFAATGSNLKVSVACPGNIESRIREGERNRPAALRAHSTAEPATLARLEAIFEGVMQAGRISGEAGATRILAGIEADAFYILTHPQETAPARQRLDRLGAALAA
ncbi:MAG: SDR family NAD(P)-dependent oxidoreductase [Caulobacter sp.]|nr:SDR family NAD(P)-dependent oxidoreductase [Caulobacter sp.]